MGFTDDIFKLFGSRLRENGGWCETVKDQNELLRIVSEKAGTGKDAVYFSRKVLSIAGEKLSEIGTLVESVPASDLKTVLARAQSGITSCDGLIAETGTVVCVARSEEPRMLSLLPERHIVIAHISQLYPELDPCLAYIYSQYHTSSVPSITLISGPSKTSDIEKTLVTGVHGPREFGVILVGV
jgi:L-lactate utilization protein LutC